MALDKSAKTADLYFRWDKIYSLSVESLIQRDPETASLTVSRAGTYNAISMKYRVCPEQIRNMDDFIKADGWSMWTDRFQLQLSVDYVEVLLKFVSGATPSSVQKSFSHQERWNKSAFSNFMAICIWMRFLVEDRSNQVSLASPSSTERGDRGVLIIAIGEKYIKMACSLAGSIKVGSPSLGIAVVCGKDEKASVQKLEGRNDLFDHIIERDIKEFEIDGKFNPFFSKLFVDLLSPFDETIYIDADSLIFPSSDLNLEFDRFQNCDIAPACSGVFDPLDSTKDGVAVPFAQLSLLKSLAKLERPIFRCHSYFTFFRKSKNTSLFYKTCRDMYLKESGRGASSSKIPSYGGFVPDEPIMALTTSLVEVKIYSGYYMPMAEPIVLAYGGPNACNLRREFLGITMTVPGKQPTCFFDTYNSIVSEVARAYGKQSLYHWDNTPKR